MLWLICYDMTDNRRRYRIDRILKGYGRRVQKSVFECHLERPRRRELERRLIQVVDASEDNIRFYPLCGNDLVRVKVQGAGDPPDDWEYLIV